MATLTKGKTFINGELVTPQKIHELVDFGTVSNIVNADIAAGADIALSKLATGALPTGITVASGNIVDGTIVNADINSAAAIADTKLATIATSGKVANSATSATNANTASAIVARDASGNFSAGTITAALSGNASSATTAAACSGNAATATTLQTARTINGVSFNGSANITVTAAPNAHTHAISDTTGLQAALDGKQAAGSYAAASHTHDASSISGTATNQITFQSGNSVVANSSGGLNKLEVIGTGNAAMMTFHRPGAYAAYFGLDNDNQFKIGGWSAGAQSFPILHSGNFSSYAAAASHTHSATDITSGTLANARTTATSENLVNTIVARNNFGGTSIALIDGISPGANSGIYSIYTSANNYIGGILTNGTNTGVIYSTGSDYRLKTNFEPLTKALVRLKALPVHRFHWMGHTDAPKVDGFIAHEAQAVVPEAVTGTKDAVDAEGKPKFQGIDQSKLVPLLVAAVQELAARVEALEAAR